MSLFGLCAAFIALLVTGCSLAGDLTPPPGQVVPQPAAISSSEPAPTAELILAPPPNTQPNLTRGAEIFSEKCAPCHGDLGRGGGSLASNLPSDFPPPPIGDLEYARTAKPEDWYHVVSTGVAEGFMPAFASLSDQERWDVVGYSFWLAISSENFQSEEQVFAERCAECHQEDAASGSSFALISGASMQDLFQSISEGIQPEMPAFEESFAADQRYALANFFMLRSLVGFEGATALESTDIEPLSRSVRGKVQNRSAGGQIPEGLQVTLHAFEDELEVITKHAEVDENGNFTFTDVKITADQVTVVTTEYQGVLYGTQIIQGTPEEDQSLTLEIYKSTIAPTNVVVDRLHAIFSEPAEGILEITQLWIFSNRGDETVANADGEGVLEVILPQGASNLQFEGGSIGSRFQMTDSGFLDRIPLRPGDQNHEIVFSFEMAYDRELEFSQQVQYAVEAVVMLSPESGPELKGPDVFDLGVQELNGVPFNNYNTAPLNPGDQLAATVKASSPPLSLPTDILLGGFALAAALFGARFWWLRQDKKFAAAEPGHRPIAEPSLSSQDPLIQQIAALDDAFEDGEIKEKDYIEERAALKQNILQLLKEEADD